MGLSVGWFLILHLALPDLDIPGKLSTSENDVQTDSNLEIVFTEKNPENTEISTGTLPTFMQTKFINPEISSTQSGIFRYICCSALLSSYNSFLKIIFQNFQK